MCHSSEAISSPILKRNNLNTLNINFIRTFTKVLARSQYYHLFADSDSGVDQRNLALDHE